MSVRLSLNHHFTNDTTPRRFQLSSTNVFRAILPPPDHQKRFMVSKKNKRERKSCLFDKRKITSSSCWFPAGTAAAWPAGWSCSAGASSSGAAFGAAGNSGFGCCTTSWCAIYREGRTANKNFKSSLPLVPLENWVWVELPARSLFMTLLLRNHRKIFPFGLTSCIVETYFKFAYD